MLFLKSALQVIFRPTLYKASFNIWALALVLLISVSCFLMNLQQSTSLQNYPTMSSTSLPNNPLSNASQGHQNVLIFLPFNLVPTSKSLFGLSWDQNDNIYGESVLFAYLLPRKISGTVWIIQNIAPGKSNYFLGCTSQNC